MKRLLLSFMALALTSAMVFAQEVYTEDLEDGLPTDWTTTGNWMHGNSASLSSQYFGIPEHTNFLANNDDAGGNGFVSEGTVTTGAIDLTNAVAPLSLSFQSFFINGDYGGVDETAKVYISTDGTTWDLLVDLETLSANAWAKVETEISDYAGGMIWLGFEYVDGDQWNYGWCFDDLRIGAPIERDASVELRSILNGGATGYAHAFEGTIINNGINTINSIDVNWTDGTNTYTESLTGLDIPLQGSMYFTASDKFTITEGTTDIDIWLSNMNGVNGDENAANDMVSTTITGITPDPEHGVVVEEGTGTWCPWCPRGDVFLNRMTDAYGKNFVGIAVHNGDPMVLGEYDTAIANFIGGYPSTTFNRTQELDPSQIEGPCASAMLEAPVATILVGASYDATTRDLTTSVEAHFKGAVSGNYRLAVVVSEDGVTGTGADWGQANNYAGGAVGPMGGYELLPSTVPAADMVYNHVGRALIGGFDGVDGSLPDAIAAGEGSGHTFDVYNVPADYNTDNMHLIGLLLNPAGEIVNAISVSIEDAMANGLTNTDNLYKNHLAKVYPNPASFGATIELNLESSSSVSVEAFNNVGQKVAAVNHGTLVGYNQLPFDTNNLANGVYTIHIKLDGANIVKKITVQK